MNDANAYVPGKITLERKGRSFPVNLFDFRTYTIFQVISLVILIWFGVLFVRSVYIVNFDKEAITATVQSEIEGRGYIKRAWYWIKETFWQDYPEEVKVEEKVDSKKRSVLFWPSIRMLMSWTLVWLCFDWEKAKHFVFAALAVSLGALYSLFPVDAIPDFIPVAGAIDDLTVNIFGTGLGIASIMDYYRKRKQRDYVMSLLSQYPEAAMNIALQDYDLKISPAGIEKDNV